jgi:hypothetical protein
LIFGRAAVNTSPKQSHLSSDDRRHTPALQRVAEYARRKQEAEIVAEAKRIIDARFGPRSV